jgi:hypothetical protein
MKAFSALFCIFTSCPPHCNKFCLPTPDPSHAQALIIGQAGAAREGQIFFWERAKGPFPYPNAIYQTCRIKGCSNQHQDLTEPLKKKSLTKENQCLYYEVRPRHTGGNFLTVKDSNSVILSAVKNLLVCD